MRLLGSGVSPARLPAPSPCRSGRAMLKMLSFKLLLLAVALGFFEGDAKFGDRSEGSGARRRRCLNGNPPKRLKRRDRRMMSQLELLSGGDLPCGGFYPRLSCCLRSDSPGLGRLDHKVGTHPPHRCETGVLAGWGALGLRRCWWLPEGRNVSGRFFLGTFAERQRESAVCPLGERRRPVPPPAVRGGDAACLGKGTLLWYPLSGRGKYF